MGWFTELFKALVSIFPHLSLITIREGGVRFGPGKRVEEMKPGLHFWWPLIQDLQVIPIARTSANLRTQTILTVDDVPIIVGAMAIYEIADVMKALANTFDYEDTVEDVLMTVVTEVVAPWNYKIEKTDLTVFNKKLTKTCRTKLRKYGIRVLECSLTDLAPCRVIRNVQSD